MIGDYRVRESKIPRGENVKYIEIREKEATQFSLLDYKPRRDAKVYKILPQLFFPEVTHSLWLDHRVAMKQSVLDDPDCFLGDCDMALFPHPDRNCLYAEGKAVVDNRKDTRGMVDVQMEHYRAEGMPEHFGLPLGGWILRRHTERMLQFSLAWWEQICKFSSRDQLSFPYVAWKLGIKWAWLPRPCG